MTVDDENSVYVGGLPYDITEEDLRRAFVLYGAVVTVKIINDKEVGGKCYGFVTFTNPRSAVDAINDMNGRTIGGRAVRVNEVRTRAGRPGFQRENFGRDRERDRDNDRSRDNVRFRDRERNIEHRDRDFERGHSFDRARDNGSDRERTRIVRDQETRELDRDRGRISRDQDARSRDGDWDREQDMDWDQDRRTDKSKNHDADGNKETLSRNRLGSARVDGHRSRDLSPNSGDEYNNEDDELEMSFQRSEELQKELKLLNGKVDEREQIVSDLQKKCQKLEDALASAKKLKSQHQTMLTKLHRGFMQTLDCSERLKSSEQELKALVDNAMTEGDMGEDNKYLNGQI